MREAMILAAGRGERMRPLTDVTPKCLLKVGGKPLMQWHMERLKRAGYERIVVNHAWLGEQIEAYFGDGSKFGIPIRYSPEGTALETAGGIAKALRLLSGDVFTVVNGDVFTDFDFACLRTATDSLELRSSNCAAYLVLVPNPPHHQKGDFALEGETVALSGSTETKTFSGIGVYRRDMFDDIAPGTRAALGPLLKTRIAGGQVKGQVFHGLWLDVGTPARLAMADDIARESWA